MTTHGSHALSEFHRAFFYVKGCTLKSLPVTQSWCCTILDWAIRFHPQWQMLGEPSRIPALGKAALKAWPVCWAPVEALQMASVLCKALTVRQPALQPSPGAPWVAAFSPVARENTAGQQIISVFHLELYRHVPFIISFGFNCHCVGWLVVYLLLLKFIYWDWLRDTAGRATCCNASIPFGHHVEFQMLYFRAASLLMCLGKQWKIAQVLRLLYLCGRPRGRYWLLASAWLSTCHCSHFGSKPADGKSINSLSLSYSLK